MGAMFSLTTNEWWFHKEHAIVLEGGRWVSKLACFQHPFITFLIPFLHFPSSIYVLFIPYHLIPGVGMLVLFFYHFYAYSYILFCANVIFHNNIGRQDQKGIVATPLCGWNSSMMLQFQLRLHKRCYNYSVHMLRSAECYNSLPFFHWTFP